MFKSIQEKRVNSGISYIQAASDLLWFFNSGKDSALKKINTAYGITDALVLSAIIDAENYHRENDPIGMEMNNGYFRCTAPYLNWKLQYSDVTVGSSIKRLESINLISSYKGEGNNRYIKINETNLRQIESAYLVWSTIRNFLHNSTKDMDKKVVKTLTQNISRINSELCFNEQLREKFLKDVYKQLIDLSISGITSRDKAALILDYKQLILIILNKY